MEIKAAELLKVAEEERNSPIAAAEQDADAVNEEADSVVQDGKKKYEAALNEAHLQGEKSRTRAAKRMALFKKQYESALNRYTSDSVRIRLEEDLGKAEARYDEAIKSAEQNVVEQQNAAEAVMEEAKKTYNEIVSGAEDKFYEVKAEANKVEEKALEEYFKKLDEAETKLNEERKLAFENKEKACKKTKHELLYKAHDDRNGALREVEAKWKETQTVTGENINRINDEYQTEVEDAMK